MPASTTDPHDPLASGPTLLQPEGPGAALPPLDTGFGERYQARGSIGQGGMGEVRLCADGRIGREVAMKLVRGGTSGPGSQPEGQARFYREVCVQGQLEHPSIVPVYDLGRDPQGALYFTMKRVRGQTLESILDLLDADDEATHKTYSRRKLLGAFVSVCQAVEFAHSRGVLHRDLKPGNIMLGDFGEVYVLDWGLAKVVALPEAEASAAASIPPSGSGPGGRDTTHGSLLGTPGYMSPEQADGRIDEVSVRSDVYALGAILFEILTYERLHDGDKVAALVASTIEGVDARPSVRAPARDVPPELEAACVRATALVAADRHPSARELCQAVERYLDGDRDLALRKDLAETHAAAARAAAERLFGEGSEEERTRALREAGQALALDPAHAGAARTVLRLLTTPPRQMPVSIDDERTAMAKVEQRSVMRIGTIAYMSWFLYTPVALAMGIRDYPLMTTLSLLWTAAAGIMFYYYRRPTGRIPMVLVLLTATALGLTATHFGPLLMSPSLVAINTMSFMLGREKGPRLFIIATGLLSVLVPVALQLAGVVTPSYTFSDGTLVVHSTAFLLRPTGTLLFLLIINLQMLITAAVVVARMRDLLSNAEERLMVQAWQLRQLVPEETAGAVPSTAPDVDPKACILRD